MKNKLAIIIVKLSLNPNYSPKTKAKCCKLC
jgi:hypothetical protein